MKSYNPEMHTAEHVFKPNDGKYVLDCDRSFSNHLEKKKIEM